MSENGKGGLYEAVRAVQAAVGTLPKDGTNPHYSSKYTTLEKIVETVRPLLVEHGLVWMTFPTRNAADQPSLRYELTHAPSGAHVGDTVPLMIERTSPQGLGSALTYMRRYTLCAVLDLVADEDDDGEAAGKGAKSKPAKPKQPYGQPPPGAEPAQRRRIQALLGETEMKRPELAAILGGLGVLLGEGWMDKLEPGPDGTAATLIDLLDRRNRGMDA